MGTVPWTVYAPTRRKQSWQPVDGLTWKTVEQKVKRLQMRIAKAAKLRKYRLMRSLQWILVKAEANPYDPSWIDYFKERKSRKRYSNQDGRFVEEFGLPYDNGCLRKA
jgi:hypothetical protein